MRSINKTPMLIIALLISSMGYIVSCTHDDEIVSSSSANIQRGTDVVKITDGWSFDKTHSNVMWETAYIGTGALLTGRFNQFGMTSFAFDEANSANTFFEGWGRLTSA